MGNDVEYKTIRYEGGIVEESLRRRIEEQNADGWRAAGVINSFETKSVYVVYERPLP